MSSPATISFDQGGQVYPEDLYRTERVADRLPNLDAIGPAELEAYAESGFLAVEQALTPKEVDGALAGLSALANPESGAAIQYEKWAEGKVDSMSPEERLDVTRKFAQFAHLDKRLGRIAHHPKILDVVARLLGGEPHMFQDMALIKPPGVGREKPWHQDNAFFRMVPGTPIVGVWVALDDATLENGCMRVIPGSHREGPKRHARLRDLQICDNDVEVPRAVAIPLPAGGLMFFDGLIHHGTPANRTNTRRRAMQFHYSLAEVTRTSDEEHKAVFGWVDGAEC